MKTPGTRIKAERDRQGWSQQKLADEITRIKGEKISRAAVAQWEIGSSKTQKPDNFFAAARALGLSPQWVLNEVGEKYAEDEPVRVNIITKPMRVTVITPPPKTGMEELVSLAGQLDTLYMGMLIKTARDLLAEQPAKQTPESFG